ncbi:hypothetical protein DFJ73DRAFT_930558 [Zopfochytrium polystomum]|nr:hypothetical protein DFJ73DRAFT_930558 [Zopfochytrium polystomum]
MKKTKKKKKEEEKKNKTEQKKKKKKEKKTNEMTASAASAAAAIEDRNHVEVEVGVEVEVEAVAAAAAAASTSASTATATATGTPPPAHNDDNNNSSNNNNYGDNIVPAAANAANTAGATTTTTTTAHADNAHATSNSAAAAAAATSLATSPVATAKKVVSFDPAVVDSKKDDGDGIEHSPTSSPSSSRSTSSPASPTPPSASSSSPPPQQPQAKATSPPPASFSVRPTAASIADAAASYAPYLSYLDAAALPIPPVPVLDAFQSDLASTYYGNPHSLLSPASSESTLKIEAMRDRVLRHFGLTPHSQADPDDRSPGGADHAEYIVIFAATVTSALETVAECCDWSNNSLWILDDCPLAIKAMSRFVFRDRPELGAAALAATDKDDGSSGGARARSIASDPASPIRIVSHKDVEAFVSLGAESTATEATDAATADAAAAAIPSASSGPDAVANKSVQRDSGDAGAASGAFNLLVYPAQSALHGRPYPLSWIPKLHAHPTQPFLVLVDATVSGPFNLRENPADFVIFSPYQILGFPTRLACLIRYTGGGSIEAIDPVRHWHVDSKHLAERFEDGTLPFLDIIAGMHALDWLESYYPLPPMSSVSTAAGTGAQDGGVAPKCGDLPWERARARITALADRARSAMRDAHGRHRVRFIGDDDDDDEKDDDKDAAVPRAHLAAPWGSIVAFELRRAKTPAAAAAVSALAVEAAAERAGLRIGVACECHYPGPCCVAPVDDGDDGDGDGNKVEGQGELGSSSSAPAAVNANGTAVVLIARISFGLMNTDEDVDRWLAFLEAFLADTSASEAAPNGKVETDALVSATAPGA